MKKTENKKSRSSAKKKLIPATCMLLVSATMLASSTYAWFTMSRDVEVKNISMTATTPEDTQVSLGNLTGATKGYTDNTGFLTPASTAEGAKADDNGVKAPSAGNNPTDMIDWSNAVDVSTYYALGRIIPASSVSGENIFFTPDANGVGQTIKAGAEFYTAATGKTAGTEDYTSATTNYKTRLHAFTTANDKAATTGWQDTNYTPASGWNHTEDDGYYVDIPVWFRTSAKDGVKLSVDAYVVPKTATLDDTSAVNELYKAMRVSIIPDADATANETGVKKLLPVKDGFDATNKTTKTDPWAAANASIVDFYGRNVATGAVDSNATTKAVSSVDSKAPTYAAASEYTTGDCVVDLTGNTNIGTGTGYGAAKKYYVRVWLEGEDPECWNANAGQDFTVNLKFSKIET